MTATGLIAGSSLIAATPSGLVLGGRTQLVDTIVRICLY
jgi:hypothetical protein